MKFTDEDLQELIKRLNYHASISDWSDGPFKCSELFALLARLEAAEAYGAFRIRFSSGHDGEKEKLDAWRESKGE